MIELRETKAKEGVNDLSPSRVRNASGGAAVATERIPLPSLSHLKHEGENSSPHVIHIRVRVYHKPRWYTLI